MIELVATTAQKIWAERNVFKTPKNSITDGEHTAYGRLGEIVLVDYLKELGVEASIADNKDYDIILGDGTTIDVKSAVVTTSPKESYYCNVYRTSDQQCDYYFFTRILQVPGRNTFVESTVIVYLLGYVSKARFFKEAKFLKKGASDPQKPEFIMKSDTWHFPIDRLELKG